MLGENGSGECAPRHKSAIDVASGAPKRIALFGPVGGQTAASGIEAEGENRAVVYCVWPLPACAARSGSFLSAERDSSPAAGGLREPVTFSAAVFAWDRANISRKISE